MRRKGAKSAKQDNLIEFFALFAPLRQILFQRRAGLDQAWEFTPPFTRAGRMTCVMPSETESCEPADSMVPRTFCKGRGWFIGCATADPGDSGVGDLRTSP